MLYFHKNALLTPHLHDFDNLRTFVAKFCRNNLRAFSTNLLGLKNSYRQLICFLNVSNAYKRNEIFAWCVPNWTWF